MSLASVGAATPAHAEGQWQLAQPAPPAGARFKVPLGIPDDMEFLSPNEGLLSVEGNAVVSPGLFFWDGRSWHELATVCGGSGGASRVAWAGPDEFWTVTTPSQPRTGSGLGLCHFKDGVVVGSYSTDLQSPDPFRPMDAAACDGPDDCWFAGIGSSDPTGQRIGAFHLHWDGSNLTSSYEPQGRGVSGLTFFNGTLYESTLAGTQPGDTTDAPVLQTPEPDGPALIHELIGGTFSDTDFIAYPFPGVPAGGEELLSAHSDATDLWFSGGGSASGPAAPSGGSVPAPPMAVHYHAPFFEQVPLDPSQFGPKDRFVDVAPVPGTDTAWVADQPYGQQASTSAKATVALLGADGSAQVTQLPTSGAGRGSAALVAFTGPNEGWVVTSAGWLFHYTDGAVYPQDADPAFQATITQRPNEAEAQFIPNTPPADDSQLFAPPPVQVVSQNTAAPTTTYIPVLLSNIKVKRRGLTLLVSFRLQRNARVQLVAKRKTKVVASSARRTLKPGAYTLSITLNIKQYPTALRFVTTELTKPKALPCPANGGTGEVARQCGAASAGPGSDTVTTGGGSNSNTVTTG